MKHLLLLSFLALCITHTGFADVLGPSSLLALAKRASSTLEHPSQKNLFYLEDNSTKRHKSGSAAMYFPQNIGEMADRLAELSNWCELLSLHLNIKACTFDSSKSELTVFLGRKFYQTPEQAYKLVYKFRTIKHDNYFAVMMSAKKGPIGTSDFNFDFEILDLNGKSFSRLHLSNRQSLISSIVANIYLSTAAKAKSGISIIGYNDDGSPAYTSGETASFERNILRYYFAISAFLQNINISVDKQRHVLQLNTWYAQTTNYPQLYEIQHVEYVSTKTRERVNQTELQNADANIKAAKYEMTEH
jgi:hypothetical protein